MKKVCCQIAKNSAHKHGKGDMEEWESSEYMENGFYERVCDVYFDLIILEDRLKKLLKKV